MGHSVFDRVTGASSPAVPHHRERSSALSPSTVGSNRPAVTTLTLPAVAQDHIGVDKSAGLHAFLGIAQGLAQRRTVFLVERSPARHRRVCRHRVNSTPHAAGGVLPRSYRSIPATSPTAVLGHIQQHTEFDTELAQRDAWLVQIATLQQSLDGLSGFVLMEFIVPRIGSRIDAVVIVGPIVFVLEFKVGATDYTRDHRNQVWDYALDLKYFHRASHDAPIVPILIATEAASSEAGLGEPFIDNVFPPALSNAEGLRQLIDDGIRRIIGVPLDPIAWAKAPYKPTPTIIEAARALYAEHSVDEISRSDAGARNLTLTSRRIEALIDEARAAKVKIIAFVTGVPGAGKTLVGLNIATKKYDKALDTHAVFVGKRSVGDGPT